MRRSKGVDPRRLQYRPGVWKPDAARSAITFSVRHLAIGRVRGSFERFDVTVVAPEDPAGLAVEATIDVASVNTHIKDRDDFLRTSDFFAIRKHPAWTFRSTSITAEGDAFSLTGDLTLRGVTRPVTMTGEFGGIAADDDGRVRARFRARTSVNRKDYGIDLSPALERGGLALGEEVVIDLDLQLVLQA